MKKLCLLLLTTAFSIPSFAGFVEGEQAFKEQHYSQAFSEFLPLANAGDFRSQYYVGYLYVNGYGVTQNKKEGLRYLQMSIDQNYDMAQALMAYLYSEGQLVPKDKKKAIELYQQAARQNNISANLNLGVMYYMGDSVERDYKTALDYFQKVPLDQQPIVSRYLGDIYLNNATLRDYNKALLYYEVSARQNDLSSYYNLGEMYKKGLGVGQDMNKAINYYKYAATQNYGPAQYMLGVIHANGEGVSRDIYKAFAWFQLAEEQGLTIAEEAKEKLEKNMSLSDLDMARRQVVLIQQNEMGKVEPPFQDMVATKALENATGSAALAAAGATVGAVTGKKATTKKRVLRRRRGGR